MKRIALFFLLASALTSHAQRNLNLEETVFGPRTYAPTSITAASWIPKSNSLSYLDKSYQNLLSKSAANNWTETSLLSKTELETALKAAIPNETFSLRMFPYDYKWRDSNSLLLQVDGKDKVYTVVYNVKSKSIESFIGNDSQGANRELSTDLSKIAYLVDNNIAIVDKNGKVSAVTDDSDKGIVNGSDYTHRQEFGIKKACGGMLKMTNYSTTARMKPWSPTIHSPMESESCRNQMDKIPHDRAKIGGGNTDCLQQCYRTKSNLTDRRS
ncbi:DPP IV N-terminal domain-containing protein [Sphingobacterium sp. E70]|uniref:DPP IV N-terminal domain-containing protein n=1 Tax=Sphingobacterium sp. E70 TaxID=2853439 RepID=UPI00211D124F|nr:DPP IV N-terminal domain-containing protein [Sphingobacterium sp. E70]